jgi:hypothetical protein
VHTVVPTTVKIMTTAVRYETRARRTESGPSLPAFLYVYGTVPPAHLRNPTEPLYLLTSQDSAAESDPKKGISK